MIQVFKRPDGLWQAVPGDWDGDPAVPYTVSGDPQEAADDLAEEMGTPYEVVEWTS